MFVEAYKPKITMNRDKEVSVMSFFDDSLNLLKLQGSRVFLSTDYGEKWKRVLDVDDHIISLEFDEFHGSRAFALGNKSKHFFTDDKGKTWKSFEVKSDKGESISMDSLPQISVNAKDFKLALFSFYQCPRHLPSAACKRIYYYTIDGFNTNPKKLNIDASTCEFAAGSKQSDFGDPKTIFCAENKLNSFGHVMESYLYKSQDFFKTKTTLNHNFAKSGKIFDIRVHENFVIAVVQNDKFNTKSKLTLLISKDGNNFYPSDLQIDISYGIMSFLDSSPLSLFLSVTAYRDFFNEMPVSTIYSSDSSGLRMTKILENVENGLIRKVQTIDGVWIANVVDSKGSDDKDDKDDTSFIDLLMGGASKNVKSRISFNDGIDWQDLKVEGEDEPLHLLDSSEVDGSGQFVTGPTPGILMGIGNTGKTLDRSAKHFHTYISRNGGATWSLALEKACIFSFNDLGNIIAAMPYNFGESSDIDILHYSLDQGLTWSEVTVENPFFPLGIISPTDGTSTHFLVTGFVEKSGNQQGFGEIFYAVDFSTAYDGKKCGDGDFEEIYARVLSDDNKGLCIYGHREKFKRRKANAKCFAATLFKDVTVYDESCDCTEADFECAKGFKLNNNRCEPDKRVILAMCKTTKSKELNLPDKVLVDGNECFMEKKAVKHFVSEHKFKCADYNDDNTGDYNKLIKTTINNFDEPMREYVYFEQDKNYGGENILVRTIDNRLYASRDGGIEFVKVPIYDEIIAYFVGYVPGQIILTTNGEKMYISNDAGSSYTKRKAPAPPSPLAKEIIAFHPTSTNDFIWFGSQSSGRCTDFSQDKFNYDCKIRAYITHDGGHRFKELRDDVIKCDYISSLSKNNGSSVIDPNLLFCSVIDKKRNTINLISTTDEFKHERVIAKNIVGYAVSGKFIVVGKIDETDQSLKALVSVDGKTFAETSIPHDLDIDIKQAFTILDSEEGAIFMHITTRSDNNLEYGSILKSNSNGTSYALSLDYVNRDTQGYVDFDRIQGIEGILIANVVDNYQQKESKKIKTKISHNDGGEWNYITPPLVDSKKKSYKCNGKSLKECSLNLHSFTERADYRDTFGSSSAVGVMMGLGNVGAHLSHKKDASTFLTVDGGVSWKEIKKGAYMWEYGDRGSILVLVKDGKTNKLSYSLDNGDSWKDYKFNDEDVEVEDLATVPSDNSRKFVIFGKLQGETVSFNIDFTDIYARQCQLNLDSPDNDDFEYWTPKLATSRDNCLFGHEAKYLRRAKGHNDCFIGSAPITTGFKVIRNCTCTRKDYECDYNYYRDSTDDTCKLVKGLSPSDHLKEMCKNNVFEYFEPTGYRKIPLSTCIGGKRFDSLVPKPCPGKKKEFNQHYGRDIGLGKLLLLIILPLFVFVFVTWFVYDKGIRRNGGFKQFGQIRLNGDDDFEFQPIENNQVDKVVNSIVKGGILTVASVIAVFKTVRKFDRALLERLTSQIFRTRTGRRSYVSVPDFDDEEELFGNFQDNYDQELQEGREDIYRDFDDDNIERDIEGNAATTQPEADPRLFEVDDHSD